jgi:hypothetical protein
MYIDMYHIRTISAAILAPFTPAAAPDKALAPAPAKHKIDEWTYIATPGADATDIVIYNSHTSIEYRETIFHMAATPATLTSRPDGISAANYDARVTFAADSKLGTPVIHVYVSAYDMPTIDAAALIRSHAILTARINAAENEIERLRGGGAKIESAAAH